MASTKKMKKFIFIITIKILLLKTKTGSL